MVLGIFFKDYIAPPFVAIKPSVYIERSFKFRTDDNSFTSESPNANSIKSFYLNRFSI